MTQLLSLQHGCVSRRQLLTAGLTRGQIEHRLDRGRLEPVHRGVYTVAGVPDVPLRREAAALLACGPAAVLGLLTAARMWKLFPAPSDASPIDVLLTDGNRGRTRAGIELHRTATITGADRRVLLGLPVTSPVRTLVDVATLDCVSDRRLERALDEALGLRITSIAKLTVAIAAHPGRPGISRVRELLAQRQGSTVTRTDAEERFLALIREAGLPDPQMQAPIAGFEVDAYWPEARFVVEFDSYRWHMLRGNFERDRRKDRALQGLGLLVSRVTWEQMRDERLKVATDIATALARRMRTRSW